MSNVRLTGHIVVPSSDLDDVLAELPNHIRLTLAEPGCVAFRVDQSQTDPHRFDVTEEFQDRASFDLHQARVKQSYWGAITRNVARHYQIDEG